MFKRLHGENLMILQKLDPHSRACILIEKHTVNPNNVFQTGTTIFSLEYHSSLSLE